VTFSLKIESTGKTSYDIGHVMETSNRSFKNTWETWLNLFELAKWCKVALSEGKWEACWSWSLGDFVVEQEESKFVWIYMKLIWFSEIKICLSSNKIVSGFSTVKIPIQ